VSQKEDIIPIRQCYCLVFSDSQANLALASSPSASPRGKTQTFLTETSFRRFKDTGFIRTQNMIHLNTGEKYKHLVGEVDRELAEWQNSEGCHQRR